MKIAILMGGTSAEREVSLSTGTAVEKACSAMGFKTISVLYDGDFQKVVTDLQSADLVFIALHGGQGEDGTIQACLQTYGIPFTGSGMLSSSICMNKHVSKMIVRQGGFVTPDWTLVHSIDEISHHDNFTYPIVVKPNEQGSTVGLSIVHDQSELSSALKLAFLHGKEVIVEQYIQGRELTVSIVGEQVFPIVDIRPSHELYDYECKYTEGMSTYECPAKLPSKLTKEIQQTAKKIFQILGCKNYGRIDFLLDTDGESWFLEVNTLPGMTKTSLVPKAFKAAGGSFEELIKRIIEETD